MRFVRFGSESRLVIRTKRRDESRRGTHECVRHNIYWHLRKVDQLMRTRSAQFSKGRLLLGICAALAVSSAGQANGQGLPSELPLPPGVSIARVDRMDFG